MHEFEVRAARPGWRAWWDYLEGPRLLAMAEGRFPLDPGVLSRAVQRLEHSNAQCEPEFQSLYEVLVYWQTELALPPREHLPELVRQAGQAFEPIDREEIECLTLATRISAARLTRWLATSPHAEGWYRYLGLADLRTLAGYPGPEQLPGLRARYHRLAAGYAGLDRNAVIELRVALGRLIARLEALAQPDLETFYEVQFEVLARSLEQLAEGDNQQAAIDAARVVYWLDQLGRRPDLVYAIRRYYAWPNIYVDVSGDFLVRQTTRPVRQSGPFRQQILDVDVHGYRQVQATAFLDLVPSDTQALFNIWLVGTANANSVGYTDRARAYSTSFATFQARKPLAFGIAGVSAGRAAASAELTSQIQCIAVDVIRLLRHIAQKIAWRQARERKPLMDRIAEARTEGQIVEGFEEGVASWIESAQNFYWRTLRGPLLRLNEFPRFLRFSTTENQVEVRGLLMDEFALGARGLPPPVRGEPAIAIRVHRSALGFALRQLVRRLWPDAELDQLLGLLAPFVRDLIRSEAAREGAPEIEIEREQGAEVRLEGNRADISFRLRRVTIDGETYRDLDLTVQYELQPEAGGIRFRRAGEPRLSALEIRADGRRTILAEALARRLEPYLRQLFPAEGELDVPYWFREGRFRIFQSPDDPGWVVIQWDDRQGT